MSVNLLARQIIVSVLCVFTVVSSSAAQSYLDEARLGAQKLQAWYNPNTGLWQTAGWWNAANATTVLVNYSKVSGSMDYYAVVRNTFNRNSSHGFLNNYYDDEGWWALAWIDAYDWTGNPDYLNMAESIFDDMTGGWDNTCQGGIWWSKAQSYKNAIANELFLSVAAHLANRVTNPDQQTYYINWANQEWSWFLQSEMINGNNLINDGLTINRDGSCQNNGRNTWTYNQGVILGGLAELFQQNPDPSLPQTAQNIALAAISRLTDSNGILHDRCEPNCGGDGDQFKGIFVRNLMALNDAFPDGRYVQFTQANADSIWNNDQGTAAQGTAYQFGQVWSGPFFVDNHPTVSQTSALDAIIAAAIPTPQLKPPSVPLVVRAPYMNTWLRNATDTAPGTWPKYWNGRIKAITGIAFIDGTAYLFLGAPTGVPNTMTQTALQITPTQSIFTFNGGGVSLTVDFFSPVEPTDIRRLSMPLSDIITTAQSNDGCTHTVSVYFDISGEWAHGDSNQLIRWAPETINRNADGPSSTGGTLSAWTITPNSPTVLNQVNDYPSWGTVFWAAATSSSLTTQSGADVTVRGQFVSAGELLNTNDTNQPRAINNSWPVFAFSYSFGAVGDFTSEPFVLLIGHVRDPAVSYLDSNVSSLWRQYWAAPEDMLAFAYNDVPAAMSRASRLDATITKAASAIGGSHYAALTAITLRQAFAGTELVGTRSNPWMFLEEISSDDNVSTVDVLYPSMPAFLYTNPELVKYLLAPVIVYAESGQWPQQFAPHDLGSTYPNATGHNDGGGENMPVEETANMLIMAAEYMRQTTPPNALAYAAAHYAIFKQWADYLLTVPTGVPFPNALDPQFQNQTDDFTGKIAHSVNLALKGIIGVGAMGQIAAFAGNTSDASFYSGQAQSMISEWVTLSQNSDSSHLLLQYREPANPYSDDTTGEPDTAWSLKYNAWPDKFLGLNLVPESVATEEANFYRGLEVANGIPLDFRHSYTKADWELWVAGGTDDPMLRQDIIDEVFNYANTTTCATPFPDWYDPFGTFTGFSARPVMGAAYVLLLARHTTLVF